MRPAKRQAGAFALCVAALRHVQPCLLVRNTSVASCSQSIPSVCTSTPIAASSKQLDATICVCAWPSWHTAGGCRTPSGGRLCLPHPCTWSAGSKSTANRRADSSCGQPDSGKRGRQRACSGAGGQVGLHWRWRWRWKAVKRAGWRWALEGRRAAASSRRCFGRWAARTVLGGRGLSSCITSTS